MACHLQENNCLCIHCNTLHPSIECLFWRSTADSDIIFLLRGQLDDTIRVGILKGVEQVLRVNVSDWCWVDILCMYFMYVWHNVFLVSSKIDVGDVFWHIWNVMSVWLCMLFAGFMWSAIELWRLWLDIGTYGLWSHLWGWELMVNSLRPFPLG